MLNIRNIIFDFDGVIADTEHGRYSILSDLLKNYGIDLGSKFTINDIAGIPSDIFLKLNFNFLSTATINEIVEERRRLFFNNLPKNCYVYDGAAETIKDLNDAGYNLMLATTNELIIGERLLNFIGIENEFSKKIYRNYLQNRLTNKKDYSVLTNIFHIDPQSSIIIEDSFVGVSSAKENHFFCIAFNRYNDETIRSLADLIINSFNELRSYFNLHELDTQQNASADAKKPRR